MEKLKMRTANRADENFKKLVDMFPNAVTETIDENGEVVRAIDKDVLMQEISCKVVDGREERYQFTWPDKKKSVLLANAPINKTLRPCREESVDFDNTENLYIEGDNLEVLKLLQETYLGKVKMIYIDPPYNTGNDFVYEDNFTQISGEYLANSGQFDEEGNRLVKNLESNGRFHTDWLNMIYPRLRLAKDLLKEDGIIFISINDKEIHNLKTICTNIFGSRNEVATLIWDKNHSAQAGIYKVYHEYVLVFAKNIDLVKRPTSINNDLFEAGALKKVSSRHPASEFTFPRGTRFDAPDGTILDGEYGNAEKIIVVKNRLIAKEGKLAEDVTLKAGFTQAKQMKQFFYGDRSTLVDSQGQKIVEFYFNSTGKIKVVKQRSVESPQTTCKFGTQGAASNALSALFELKECPFSSPKPVEMIADFIKRFTDDGDIIMDFFSGSATTAQALMEINAECDDVFRKYILVQIAENLDESLKHAQKDAVRTLQVAIEYLNSVEKKHTICEIGKERIRRAAKKIREENPEAEFDSGFRVLKCDTSNMKDVYYTPDEYEQGQLDMFADNIKEDRTPEDLLFQVMLDLGILLSSKIEEKDICGNKVFAVNDNYLYACFDKNVSDDTIKAIAEKKPYYCVLRDSSVENDSVKNNFDQYFKAISPGTERRVL